MRISDRYQSTIERTAPAKATTAASKVSPTAAGTDGATSILDVHVSEQAQKLSARAAGVEQLKKQVQDGTFKVDPDAIAQKLVGGDE